MKSAPSSAICMRPPVSSSKNAEIPAFTSRTAVDLAVDFDLTGSQKPGGDRVLSTASGLPKHRDHAVETSRARRASIQIDPKTRAPPITARPDRTSFVNIFFWSSSRIRQIFLRTRHPFELRRVVRVAQKVVDDRVIMACQAWKGHR